MTVPSLSVYLLGDPKSFLGLAGPKFQQKSRETRRTEKSQVCGRPESDVRDALVMFVYLLLDVPDISYYAIQLM